MKLLKMLVKVLPVLLLLPILGGCAISEDEEIKMGLQSAPKIEKEFGGLYPDQQVQSYVREVGMGMVKYTDRSDLPWDFKVVNSKIINAFALPGGQVYITKGLLRN